MRRKLKWTVLAALAVLLIVAVAIAIFIYVRLNSDTIELGETHGELAFMSDRDGDWDLYVLDPDGNLRNITNSDDAHEYFFNFMFSGNRLGFYTSSTGEITPGQVNTDGSDLRALSFIESMMSVVMEGELDMDPAWAPGGEKLAWTRIHDMNLEIFVSNSDGSESRRLTNDSGSDTMIAWSPDGNYITYVSDREGQQDVMVINVESGEETRLTEVDWDLQPIWSIDGEQILFVKEGEEPLTEGYFDVYVMNRDGSDLHVLGEDEVFKGDLTYSPYGGQVAFMSNEEGTWHIYVMDADGSNERRVTEGDGNYMFPAWRPVPADEQNEDGAELTIAE
jgi:Tol biopolymer transport system component